MDTIEARDIIKRMCKGDPTPIQLEALDIAYDILSIGLNPEQIRELKERDKPKQVVYEHEFEDSRLISYVQKCKSCGEAYDPSERFNFCPNCGQRILRRKVIVKAFANYGFAGTEMEFEEEFPDNATDEEIEETMKDIVYERVDWSWRKEDTHGDMGRKRTEKTIPQRVQIREDEGEKSCRADPAAPA